MRRTGWLAGGYVLSATGCALATLRSRAAFGDLSIYAAGGAAVRHGTPLYQLRFAFGLRFTYPPFAALLFAPLSWLPVTAGRVLVSAATILALPVTSYLALRLPPWSARLSRDRAAHLALAFSAAAIWLEPERTNLKYGQINVFLTALVLLDLVWVERDGNHRFGGALIGIAAGIKLTPALFAVYLLATRRYRAAATAAATFAATVAIAFALVPGDAARYWDLSFLTRRTWAGSRTWPTRACSAPWRGCWARCRSGRYGCRPPRWSAGRASRSRPGPGGRARRRRRSRCAR